MSITKKIGETQEEFESRMIDLKMSKEVDISWKQLHKLLKKEGSVDHFRKVATGIYKANKANENLMAEVIEDYEDRLESLDKEREKLERRLVNFEKKKVEVSSLRNNINKIIREESRSETYLQELLEAIDRELYKSKAKPFVSKYESGKKDIVLNIADMHFGREMKLYNPKNELINEYSPEIFKERMMQAQVEIIDIMREEKVGKLHIFNLSDSIDGILRASQLQSLALGIADSVIELIDFMIFWLDGFLLEGIELEYFSSWGNHNEIRPLASNSGDFAHENTERIITHGIKNAFRNNDNIIVHDALKYHYVEIANYKIMATHGQYAGSKESIVKDYSSLYNMDIDMLLIGHLHKYAIETVGANADNNIQIVRAPSICGVDDYATDRLMKNAKAGVMLMVLESTKKIKKTYDIILN